MGKVRVALCDDHPVLRESMEIALGRDRRFDVVGSWSAGADLLARWRPEDVDLVVVDMAMSPMGGVELIKRLRERDPEVRILVLSAFEDPHLVRDALDAGAGGYLLKTTEIRVLKDTMVAVAGGLQVLDPNIDMRAGRTMLSRRQMEILELQARGLSRQEIADNLMVTVNTVKHHTNAMYGLMGVHGALEAVAKARELGWLPAAEGLPR